MYLVRSRTVQGVQSLFPHHPPPRRGVTIFCGPKSGFFFLEKEFAQPCPGALANLYVGARIFVCVCVCVCVCLCVCVCVRAWCRSRSSTMQQNQSISLTIGISRASSLLGEREREVRKREMDNIELNRQRRVGGWVGGVKGKRERERERARGREKEEEREIKREGGRRAELRLSAVAACEDAVPLTAEKWRTKKGRRRLIEPARARPRSKRPTWTRAGSPRPARPPALIRPRPTPTWACASRPLSLAWR